MSVRTTIDLPDELYEALRKQAAGENTSIRSLVVAAIEARFARKRQSVPVLKPPVPGSGKPGPRCPDRENPYDILFT
jgi:hypothetical protein